MWRCVLLLFAALCVSVQAQDTLLLNNENEAADPCSCALLNFWDIKPREDATECCEALKELCFQSNSTLHCGHVYRFCLKRRAGFSAYILDEFVRTQLRQIEDLECDAFNPLATHENELCGGGYCRIGYTCAKVRAEKCFSDGGVVCGDGYCNSGAECAEMSTEVCKRFREKNLEKKKLKNYGEPVCKKGYCEACKTVTEYKCAFKKAMTDPCTEKGCARGRRCVNVVEEVCAIRPDAALYLNGEDTHDPEQVSRRFRRFTAVVLPVVAVLVACISVIAFISWATIRVRKARKEVGFEEESEDESPRAGDDTASKKGTYEKDVPLSPPKVKRPNIVHHAAASLAHSVADILSPRLRLSSGQSRDYDAEHTPHSLARTPPRGANRFFSPHRRYSTLDGNDSLSDSEMTPRVRIGKPPE